MDEIDKETVIHKENFAKKFARGYGEFVARRPLIMLGLVFLVLFTAFYGASLMKTATMDNRDIIPEGIEVIEVFSLVAEKFPGNTDSFQMAIELNSRAHDANITDIREPNILKYSDVLAMRLDLIEDVSTVQSVTDFIKDQNGRLPRSLESVKSAIEQSPFSEFAENFISPEYDLIVIKVGLSDDYDDPNKLYDEAMQALDELKGQKPSYVDVYPVGNIAISRAISQVMQDDMGKTTSASLFFIFFIILILFMSLRHTIFALLGVIFGLIWAFGIAGLTGLPLNELVSGAASMILGIGIDFGIQTVTRFRQELKEHTNLEAVVGSTVAGVFIPLGTTTLVGVIGFISMSAGQLTIMADLGTMMIYGIVSCFLAAISIIPSVLVINERLRMRYNNWRNPSKNSNKSAD